MAGEPQITVIGNLAEDPKPFVTQAGMAITNVTVLNTPRNFDRQTNDYKDGVTNRFEVKGFRELAAHSNLSLKKGMRVVIIGHIETETWQDKDTGANRYKQVIIAEEIAVSLRFGTVAFQKSAPQQQNAGQAPQMAQQGQPQAPQQPMNQQPQQQFQPQAPQQPQQPQQQMQGQPQAPQQPQQQFQPQAPQQMQGQPTPQQGDLGF